MPYNKDMKILVTNDDGIESLGLLQMVDELSKIGDVYVVAPESERSSNSHHLTISGMVRFEQRDIPNAVKAYALWGTPADCTHAALSYLFDEKFDLVVSGINCGPNVSTDIIYSGTVAGAREALILGVPAMAMSLCNFNPANYDTPARVAREVAEEFMKIEDKDGYLINVNVPDLPYEELKGVRICDEVASINYHDNHKIEKIDGKDYIVVTLGTRSVECDRNNLNIDLVAVENGYVSITPLYNQHIDYEHLKSIQKLAK